MSWGVNLAMAGAAARGMRQAEADQADLEFTEKTRDYHLKNLASNEAMRPEREAAERGRLRYQSDFYRGANESLPMEQDNQRLQLGVNNAVLKQQGAEVERAAKMTESMRGAAASGWARAKELNLPPEQAMSVVLEHQAQAAFANNDPVRAQQIMEAMNTERARQSFRLFNEAVQAQMTGNMPALATSLTNLYNTLNPGSPGSVVPVMTEQPVAGMPPPTPSAFRLTLERDGQVTTQDLTPEQMKALSMQYINMIGSDPIAAIEGQREVAKQRAIAQAKGEQDRETAAFKGENFVKVKTGENQEALFNTQTGQMVGGGAGPGAGEPSLTPKEVDQVRQAAEAVLKANQMAVMTEEGQKMLAQVTGKAGAYMRMGVLDEYGQRLDANSAVSLAWRVSKGLVDEAKLQRGAPAGGASFGANQSPAAAPSAATPAAAGSAQPNPNEWAKDSAGNYWKIDPATGGPAKGPDGKLIAWQAGGSATAATPATPATVPATPGVEARPANTSTAAGEGEMLPASVPDTPVPEGAQPVDKQARARYERMLSLEDRIAALEQPQAPKGPVAEKRLAEMKAERDALRASPEVMAFSNREEASRGRASQADMSAATRARDSSAVRSRVPTAKWASEDRKPAAPAAPGKPARPVDVLDNEVASPSPAASTAPTPAAPAATAPTPARPRPAVAPAVGGVNALDPAAFSPNMGTQVMPAASTRPTPEPGGRNPSNDEAAFQKWIRNTGWFKEFKAAYGEEPDLDAKEYDYRSAWRAGIQPERDPYDNNRYHWPSSLPDGQMLKSPDHPTAWKEYFMRETGKNPDALGLRTQEEANAYLKNRKGGKPTPARPVAEGANEFERTKGYGVRGKGTPDKGQDTTEAKPTQGMPQLPKPDSVTSMGDESAPNHIVNVRRQVAAQAQERLQRADLAFFEKYAQFLQPEERSRWVKALNERIAKDGMSGLVPKTRKYVVGPDGNLMRAAN